jgi:hypothetical protein
MPFPGTRTPAPRSVCHRPSSARILAALLAVAVTLPVWSQDSGELGLPFTRFYSYEEIGNTSRGMRLGFDPLGRIAVTRAGSCIVLNDTTWLDIAEAQRLAASIIGNGTIKQERP